ncbi:MAG: hypothetical protein HC844_10480 [Tabrizicola sp.]|nr:hypothetical protein [Tabrizicola sp.]
MERLLPFALLLLMIAAGWAAWRLALRHGLWPGLLVPALAFAGTVIRLAPPGPGGPPGPVAVQRGFEVLLFWTPMTALTVICAALGLFVRWRSRSRPGE